MTQSVFPFAPDYPQCNYVYTYEVTHPFKWAWLQLVLNYQMLPTHCLLLLGGYHPIE